MLSSAVFPSDAVALKPAWSTLLASLRFARVGRWQFGNGTGMLRCLEHRARPAITDRGGDALRFRFDLRRWHGAFARSTGAAREIGIVADDGSAIFSLHLEGVDAGIDELIWRLIDDDAAAPVIPTGTPSHGDTLTLAGAPRARRLTPSALPTALRAARDARLPLRIRIENAGGGVTQLALHAADVDVIMPSAGASVWAVARANDDVCGPTIESSVAGERGFIRVDVTPDTATACASWRRICAALPQE
jgi:hypothetical protein